MVKTTAFLLVAGAALASASTVLDEFTVQAGGGSPFTPLAAQELKSFAQLGDADFSSASEALAMSLTGDQKEALMMKLWEQMDVVDLMRLTGHGHNLDEMRLVHVAGEDEARYMSEGDKLRLKRQHKKFMDITFHPNLENIRQAEPVSFVAPVQASSAVATSHATTLASMFDKLTDKDLRLDIGNLSGFWTRNYNSEWGLKSSNWIYDRVEKIFQDSKSKISKLTVTKFGHKFPQNSIIARLESKESADVANKTILVVSAHQDSLNYLLPFYRAPGADDDGSGSVTIMQVLRSLLEDNFEVPKDVAIEFQWYAGEEGGLLGSQDVASSYAKANAPVKAVFHMDMVAFVKTGTTPRIAFFNTNTDKNLTSFAGTLVDKYLDVPWNLTNCGSSCGSDHMSWTKAGYTSLFATEGMFEDFPRGIHTTGDNLTPKDGAYSYEHMLRFVKLALAFVVELA